MAVKLRLKRIGRTHRAVYRVAVMDSRRPRDGRVLEEVGHYDPANRAAEQQVRLDEPRIRYWLGVGAVPTDTVAKLLARRGILTR
jgi:small subunit ribosomal protein S16